MTIPENAGDPPGGGYEVAVAVMPVGDVDAANQTPRLNDQAGVSLVTTTLSAVRGGSVARRY